MPNQQFGLKPAYFALLVDESAKVLDILENSQKHSTSASEILALKQRISKRHLATVRRPPEQEASDATVAVELWAKLAKKERRENSGRLNKHVKELTCYLGWTW